MARSGPFVSIPGEDRDRDTGVEPAEPGRSRPPAEGPSRDAGSRAPDQRRTLTRPAEGPHPPETPRSSGDRRSDLDGEDVGTMPREGRLAPDPSVIADLLKIAADALQEEHDSSRADGGGGDKRGSDGETPDGAVVPDAGRSLMPPNADLVSSLLKVATAGSWTAPGTSGRASEGEDTGVGDSSSLLANRYRVLARLGAGGMAIEPADRGLGETSRRRALGHGDPGQVPPAL